MMEERIREDWRGADEHFIFRAVNCRNSRWTWHERILGKAADDWKQKRQEKSSHFILLYFLINCSFIPMESSVGEQERKVKMI